MPGLAAARYFCLDIAPLFQGLQVLWFTGKEGISELFNVELEVVIDDPELDAQSLLYRQAYLHFEGRRAGIHGQIHSVVRSHFKAGPACYHLSLGPRLACLGQRYTPRIFQRMRATEIIARVLLEHGIRDDSYQFDIKADSPVREFCAQYCESDLQLVQRLCAEEGIHYHFQHSPKGHVLVFGTGLRGFRRSPLAHVQRSGVQPGVRNFSLNQGSSNTPDHGRGRGQGESNLTFMASGYLLPLKGHPQTEWNHLWLVTGVVHRGMDPRQPQAVSGPDRPRYLNQFQVAPWERGFLPPPRPPVRLMTTQRATVLGPLDQPVSLDAQGRLKVQFDWNYQGQGAVNSHCWLPLDPRLNTPLYGGMQVLVNFVDDDNARPLVIACIRRSGQPARREASQGLIEARLALSALMGDQACIQIEGGARINVQAQREVSFRVGDSTLKIDANGITLSSREILFSGVGNPDNA